MMRSNDYREIDYVLDDIVKTVNVDFISQVMPREDAVIVERAIKARINFYKRCCHWLAICFSTEKDDLGQWRAYGDDGSGVSIGFDIERLKEFTEHKCFRFESIKYGEKAGDRFIQEVTYDLLRDFDSCLRKNSIRSKTGLNSKGIDIIKKWGDELTGRICFYKSQAFENEKEHRLCYTRMIIEKDLDIILNPEDAPDSMLHNLAVGMKYGEMNLRLERKFPHDAICEIIIGPKCKISSSEMCLLLAVNGFDYKRVKISKSDVTYRN